ncbi:MAG: hypothetical protein FWD69_13960 [Polyangiaceae bacterium]|nr:hypothetical protein [Polyangiaceae bacterium]
MRTRSFASLAACTLTLAASFLPAKEARAADTDRSKGWQTATTITMAAGVGTSLFMPRVYYSDSGNQEIAIGWKSRWHATVLAPVAVNVGLTLLNEFVLKDKLKSFRPGCDETIQGTGRCQDYGSFSSFAFLSLASLGQTGATFFVDTFKWSDGRVNGGSILGNLVLPLALSAVTVIGRSDGNWESNGQLVASGAAGLAIGIATGLLYSIWQKPECGYTSTVLCW